MSLSERFAKIAGGNKSDANRNTKKADVVANQKDKRNAQTNQRRGLAPVAQKPKGGDKGKKPVVAKKASKIVKGSQYFRRFTIGYRQI